MVGLGVVEHRGKREEQVGGPLDGGKWDCETQSCGTLEGDT
jgi:hypothetical protein